MQWFTTISFCIWYSEIPTLVTGLWVSRQLTYSCGLLSLYMMTSSQQLWPPVLLHDVGLIEVTRCWAHVLPIIESSSSSIKSLRYKPTGSHSRGRCSYKLTSSVKECCTLLSHYWEWENNRKNKYKQDIIQPGAISLTPSDNLVHQNKYFKYYQSVNALNVWVTSSTHGGGRWDLSSGCS